MIRTKSRAENQNKYFVFGSYATVLNINFQRQMQAYALIVKLIGMLVCDRNVQPVTAQRNS
jgi:hypothetical protein